MAVTQRKRNPIMHQNRGVTDKNKETAVLVALGFRSDDMAITLKMSRSGAEQRIQQMTEKADAYNRVYAVYRMLKEKHITLEDIEWVEKYLDICPCEDKQLEKKPAYITF